MKRERWVIYSTLPEVGGGATICLKLAEQMRRRGDEVIVLTRRMEQPGCEPISERNQEFLRKLGCEVIVLRSPPLGINVPFFYDLAMACRKAQGGVLVSIGMGWISIVLALVAGCRTTIYYYISHNEESREFKRNIYYAAFFNIIATISPVSLRPLRSAIGSAAQLVWLPQFSEFPFERRSPCVRANERVYIGYLGFLGDGKGVARLLAAAKSWGRNVGVVFAGDGPLLNVVKSAEAESPERQILYLGKYSGETRNAFLNAFFSRVNLLVVPSMEHSEGVQTVILEAICAGVPVVSSNLGGTKCFALPWLRPSDDVIALVEIEKIFEYAEKRATHGPLNSPEIAERCRAFYSRWFSDATVSTRWLAASVMATDLVI